MRDLGAIAILSLLLASGIVAMWREILTGCVIICLAVIFAGVLAIASEAKGLLTSAQIARSFTTSQSCRWAAPSALDTEPDLRQTCIAVGRASLESSPVSLDSRSGD